MAYKVCRMAIPVSRIDRIRAGRSLGREAPLAGLVTALNLPVRTIADALAIPERTMHRLKHASVVPSVIADKVARVHDVLEYAGEVLGSRASAQAWLVRPVPFLAGKTPLSLLDTSLGWERVKEALGRIDHGIPW